MKQKPRSQGIEVRDRWEGDPRESPGKGSWLLLFVVVSCCLLLFGVVCYCCLLLFGFMFVFVVVGVLVLVVVVIVVVVVLVLVVVVVAAVVVVVLVVLVVVVAAVAVASSVAVALAQCCCCCCCLTCLLAAASMPAGCCKSFSSIFFPYALPLASAGVGGYITYTSHTHVSSLGPSESSKQKCCRASL